MKRTYIKPIRVSCAYEISEMEKQPFPSYHITDCEFDGTNNTSKSQTVNELIFIIFDVAVTLFKWLLEGKYITLKK